MPDHTISAWVLGLPAQGQSPRTLSSYQRDAERLAACLTGPLEEAIALDLRQHLAAGRRVNTVAGRRAMLAILAGRVR